jgi:hypothetical protein
MFNRLIFAVAFLAIAPPAAAQTPQQPVGGMQQSAPSPETANARQAIRQACAGDAANFCKDVQPGGGRILKCLKDHQSEISQGCKNAWESLRAARMASHAR